MIIAKIGSNNRRTFVRSFLKKAVMSWNGGLLQLAMKLDVIFPNARPEIRTISAEVQHRVFL